MLNSKEYTKLMKHQLSLFRQYDELINKYQAIYEDGFKPLEEMRAQRTNMVQAILETVELDDIGA